MTNKEAIAKAPRRRKTRTGLGTRQVLSVKGKDPDFEYRIVNDTGDRVQQLQEEDWEICEASGLQVGDKRVGNPTTNSSLAEVSVGQGMKAFVMRKRKDWYAEDAAEKQEYVNKTEAATKQQALDGNYGKLEINSKS